jgi:hypothetical protein
MYLNWIEKYKRRNELAQFSLPFGVQPVRDTCNVMADVEVDPRFAIHTSVFLADGAGSGYRGGVGYVYIWTTIAPIPIPNIEFDGE